MSITFSGSELVNIAINIEKRGIAFYDIMARSTGNAAARHVFQHLAEMEREHMRIFQEMLLQADTGASTDTGGEEYAGYLQALLESAVFTDDDAASEMATRADSDLQALELGMVSEKDSILFYYEMLSVMPSGTHPTVNRVILEEKSHLAQLTALKKELAARK